MATKKNKTSGYAARSGGKTTSLGSSAAKKTVKKAARSAAKSAAGYKRTSGKKKNSKLNWAFIVAGAVLLSTYMIVVLFNGFDWSGWEDGVNDLKDSASGAAGTLSSAWDEIKDSAASSPDDLTLDTSGTAAGEVQVHFIDIGQGDSELIVGNGEAVLIDAGDNDKGDEVLAYLEQQGISKIDLAIGTHPHADHIGGMDTVIEGTTVDKLLLSDIPDSLIPTTKTYLSLLDAADERGTEMLYAYPGDTFQICGGTLSVLGPVQDYKDLNNESLVVRFDYGENSFLFTGDQEAEAEADLIASGAQLSADVLKLGHHGSSTSTSEAFFDAVSPKIGIISCGTGNSYGHPHKETLQLLNQSGIDFYRTDLLGNIVVTSNGTTLQVATEKAG